jgi:hypothetical protein
MFRFCLILERNVTPTEINSNMRKLQLGGNWFDPDLRNCSFHRFYYLHSRQKKHLETGQGISIYLSVCLSVCLSIYLSVYLSIYLSIYLWLYGLCGPWPFFKFLDIYTVSRTFGTGDQPVARPLPTHRRTQTQNKRKHIHALTGVRTRDPNVQAGEEGSCLRLRGHCDLHFHISVSTIYNLLYSVNFSLFPKSDSYPTCGPIMSQTNTRRL